MESLLTNQVYVYSVSTDVFFTKGEQEIKTLKDRLHDQRRLTKDKQGILDTIDELTIELSQAESQDDIKYINKKIKANQRSLEYLDYLNNEVFVNENYSDEIKQRFNGKKLSNAGLKKYLKSNIEAENNRLTDLRKEGEEVARNLNRLKLSDKSKIGLFESTLTRKLKLEKDQFSDKLIVVEIFNYEILKSLLDYGFTYNGQQYVRWSASGGAIRDKKFVFIHKETWDKIENSITAGLNDKIINENGGMSVNKYTAYKALASSASTKWESFDIDKCIVVDDVKVSLEHKTVDFISRDTFEIERDYDYTVNLEITDGAGMYLPKVSEELFGEGVYKNMQYRAPWMKGCLSPVPFDEFTDNPKVTDIYGKEWDIIEDDIQIIFFKSQFKMWKHFINKDNHEESWQVYKDNFKKYDCEAAYMNPEEDNISDAKLNYQYIQSLVSVSNEDLMELARLTNDEIQLMGSDADTMIKVLGAEDGNPDMNEFQKAINLYPALLNDENSKMAIKNRKKKMLKEAKAGKLNIDGKYTYVLPDWYAVMENIFNGVENPKGLLNENEVYCSLYDQGAVDLMRAPALSFEHVLRENTRDKDMEEWFLTKAVHVSAQDAACSKILMMDYDGDKIMISPSELLIKLVKDNSKNLDVVPLEYEMGVAAPKLINSDNIFESLQIAFKANIGLISNVISKLFNKDDFDPDKDYSLIKKFCSYNNHIIDMAKTLDEVKLPDDLKPVWNYYNKLQVPYLFKYAKSKKSYQDKNESTVNRLEDIIINKNIHFKSVVGKFDYKKLMWKQNIKDSAFIVSEEKDKEIIRVYTYLDRNKKMYLPSEEEASEQDNKKQYIYLKIREDLMNIHHDAQHISDILVRYLFKVKNSKYKTTLFESFGNEIIKSLRKNLLDEIDCITCGTTVKEPSQRQTRCEKCQGDYRRKLDKLRKRKEREKLEEMSA